MPGARPASWNAGKVRCIAWGDRAREARVTQLALRQLIAGLSRGYRCRVLCHPLDARALLGRPAPVEGSTGHTQLKVALLFRGLADALDGIAYCRTELPQQRCRGALHLPHGVVNPRV